MVKRILGLFFLILMFVSFARSAYAVRFELIPPSGQLTRGQDVAFTINIDSQGESITSIQTGMTYDTQYLEYVSAAPGAAMDSISPDTSQGTGKLVLTGTKAGGFTGTGVYAVVTFKLIAQEAGSTELCTLWTPSPSPTVPPVLPTSPPAVYPTTPPPPPTALPQTGFDIPKNTGTVAGIFFILTAAGVFYYSKQTAYTPKASSHKTVKKHS